MIGIAGCKGAGVKKDAENKADSGTIGSSANAQTEQTESVPAIPWDETKQNPDDIVAYVPGKPEYDVKMKNFLEDYRVRATVQGLNTKDPADYAYLTSVRTDIADTLKIERVIVNKAKELGITAKNFTAEDNKTVNDMLEQYKQQISYSVGYDTLVKEAGVTDDYFRTMAVNSVIENKLADAVTKDVNPSQEELDNFLEQLKSEAKEEYEADPKKYGSDGNPWFALYVPGDSRLVSEILVSVSNEVISKVEELKAQGKTDEANKLLNAETEKIRPEAEKALNELKSGKPFAKVMEQYSSDKIYTETYPDGFPVTKTNDYLGNEFNKATFSLQKKGDFSDIIKEEYGWGIIEYTDDAKPLAEVYPDTRKQLLELVREELTAQKKNHEYNQFVSKAIKDAAYNTNYELIGVDPDNAESSYAAQ
jgi:hypothetical protein